MAWYHFAYGLFFLVGITLFFGNLKWSFIALLVAVNIDVTAPGYDIQYASLLNTIRLSLPLVVLVRLSISKKYKLLPIKNISIILYGLFITYCLIAILWSPFKIGGVKAIFYFLGYYIWILVFYNLFLNDLISVKKLLISYIVIIIIAIFQSYVLLNPFGVREFSGMRFTSFAPPQRFAAFILIVTAFLLFLKNNKYKYMILIVSIIVIYLNGSRYIFVALMFMAATYFIYDIIVLGDIRKGKLNKYTLLLVIITSGFLGSLFIDNTSMEENRLIELTQSGFNPENIGTFIWRLRIYEAAFSDIREREIDTFLIGKGTSSSAEVGLRVENSHSIGSIDENRIMHNELLRSLYEWGLIGFVLFIIILAYVFLYPIKLIYSKNTLQKRNGVLMFSCLPALALGILIENILSGSGTPSGTAISLLIAFMLVINKVNNFKVLKE